VTASGSRWLRLPRTVLDAAAARHGFELAWTEFDWSCQRCLHNGAMMPADGLDQLREHDSVFLGAVGFPGVADHVSLWGLLIPIRRSFAQYVNLRPVRLLPGVPSPLAGRGQQDVDMVVVRENSEGEYSQIGGRHGQGSNEFAVQESVFTRRGVERIARYAFELARGRRPPGVLSDQVERDCAHDAVLGRDRGLGGRWYSDIAYEQMHIDALAARMVLAPDRFDVIVGSNLFGDILSDLAAALAGSLGVAPSGNINPEREFPSMFESVHGSAPDIAGGGIANPVAQILAGAMMLDHLGEQSAADAIRTGVDAVLAERIAVPPDLGGQPALPRRRRVRQTEKRSQSAIALRVPGDPQTFPHAHLVGGEHRLAQPLLEILQPGNGVQGGVGQQYRVGVGVVVGDNQLDHCLSAERPHLGCGDDAPAGQTQYLDAAGTEELHEPFGHILRIGRGHSHSAGADRVCGADEGKGGARRWYAIRPSQQLDLFLRALPAEHEASTRTRPHDRIHVRLAQDRHTLRQPVGISEVQERIDPVRVLADRGVYERQRHLTAEQARNF